MDPEKSELKRGKPIHGQSREIIYNVYKYFVEEANRFKHLDDSGGSNYFKKIQERVTNATGISRRTLNNILNEVDTAPSYSKFQFKTPTKGRPKKQKNEDKNYHPKHKHQNEQQEFSDQQPKRQKIEDESNLASKCQNEKQVFHVQNVCKTTTEPQNEYRNFNVPNVREPVVKANQSQNDQQDLNVQNVSEPIIKSEPVDQDSDDDTDRLMISTRDSDSDVNRITNTGSTMKVMKVEVLDASFDWKE